MFDRVYIVRNAAMTFVRRVKAASENKAVAKVIRKHGGERADYIVYQF